MAASAPPVLVVATLAVFASQCWTIAALLALPDRAGAWRARRVAAFFVIAGAIGFAESLARSGAVGPGWAVGLAMIFLAGLLGPALLRVVAAMNARTEGNSRAAVLLQLLPATAITAGTGALLAWDALAPGAGPSPPAVGRLATQLIALQIGACLALGLRAVRRRERALAAYLSTYEAETLRRTRFLLLILTVPWALLAVELAAGLVVGLPWEARYAAGVARAGALAALGWLAVAWAEALFATSPREAEAEAMAQTPRYARSGLDADDVRRLADKIARAMQDGRLFAEPDLTLSDLARAVGAPPQRVSQALSQALGTSFFGYVNAMRVEAAQRLMRAEPTRQVFQIALEVGFNSKSTFNKAFKDAAGMTPSEWRQRHREPS